MNSTHPTPVPEALSTAPGAFVLPCARCGAALPVLLGCAQVDCRFCGARHPLTGPQVDRLNRHGATLQAFDREARAYQLHAENFRISRRHGAVYALIAFGPSFGAPVAFAVAQEVTGARYKVPYIELIFFGISVAAFGSMGALMAYDGAVAKRRVAGLSQQRIAQSCCGACGATAPAILGRPMQCPFCDAALLPGEDVAHNLEAAARAQVGYQAARMRGEAPSLSRGGFLGPFVVLLLMVLAASLIWFATTSGWLSFPPTAPTGSGTPSTSSSLPQRPRHR